MHQTAEQRHAVGSTGDGDQNAAVVKPAPAQACQQLCRKRVWTVTEVHKEPLVDREAEIASGCGAALLEFIMAIPPDRAVAARTWGLVPCNAFPVVAEWSPVESVGA